VDSPGDIYLRTLKRALRGNPFLARRILAEVADHLAEAVEAGRRTGMTPNEAEADAIGRLGPPDEFARRFDRFATPLRLLLIGAAACTVCIALWLLWVCTVVLPTRDPAHVAMWRLVAIGYLAYSALSWAALLRHTRSRLLRGLVVAVSAIAVGLGLCGIWTMLGIGRAGGHFEGYIVLMGLLLCGHGLAAIVFALITRRAVGLVTDGGPAAP
jgi:hypothetical protein